MPPGSGTGWEYFNMASGFGIVSGSSILTVVT